MGISSQYTVLFLDSVKERISSMSETDSAKVAAAITIMRERNFHLVEIKTLKSPIRELKIKKYRLVFFIHGKILYFIHVFVKKTAKTPKVEIEYVEKIYKKIIKN